MAKVAGEEGKKGRGLFPEPGDGIPPPSHLLTLVRDVVIPVGFLITELQQEEPMGRGIVRMIT